MRSRRWVIIACVLLLFSVRPLLGYDTYYLFTKGFEAPPLATVIFHALGGYGHLLAAAVTIISVAILAWAGVDPLLIVALPYLFLYTFRLEDDQLAFPLVALSSLLFVKGRRAEGLLVALPGLLLWRGMIPYIAMYILADVLPQWGGVLAGLAFGAYMMNPIVAEQNPVSALFFAPVIYILGTKVRHKMDNLTLAFIAAGLLYPKWLWTALPLMYYHMMEWWARLDRAARKFLVVAGIVALVVAAAVAFPQPWIDPAKICPTQTEEEWGIGWWCRAHGYDVPFAGSPPGSKVISTTSYG